MDLELPEFVEFPKIPRLSRPAIITEKIDGTNGQIMITDTGEIYVGSRTRWLSDKQDNHGFWHWVMDRRDEVLTKLGPGRHFGEFWGSGIQRGYGLTKGDKRFSLFNVTRWENQPLPPGIFTVPVLFSPEVFSTHEVVLALSILQEHGSFASPGFMNPEGVVVYHPAGNLLFKKTIDKDEEPKGK